jgi:beta-lactamase superfamily II metal-dependent hydrolase
LICNRCQIELTSPNCLFTGDFEKKYVTEMKNLYNTNKLWDSIQTIQIPHHGSKYNYSSDLYDCASCGFVSFGTTNAWNLPDKETLLNVNNQGCLPLMVTENKKTKIIFHYFE